MAIINRKSKRLVIDLAGPQGNAFFLLGTAQRFAREMGLDGDAIMKDMQSSDYEHLIQVFDQHFGLVCDLERP